ISLQFVPFRRFLPFLLVPAGKVSQRLPIVPLSIDRRAALRGEVREKLLTPLVVDFRIGFGGFWFHLWLSRSGTTLEPLNTLNTRKKKRRAPGQIREFSLTLHKI